MQSLSAERQAAELQARLSRIEQLLNSDPAGADAQAAELLAAVPAHPMALLFQAIARRLMGNPAGAVEILAHLCRSWPGAPLPQLQLGLALRQAGEHQSAVQAMRQAVAIKADFGDAWLALADLLTALADAHGADQAFGMYIKCSARDPRFQVSRSALRENRVAEAEALLNGELDRHPTDVVALCMLADVVARQGRTRQAHDLLARCLELAPSYRVARHNFAVVLMRQERPIEALREVDRLLAEEPTNPDLHTLKAAVSMRIGAYEAAIDGYAEVLRQRPEQPRLWASMGHALRMVGRRQASIEAYRKAIAIAPGFGAAYWDLANFKTLRLSAVEIDSIRAQLQKSELAREDRIHFNFALGKALEDEGEFAESFRHYAAGNHLRRQSAGYAAEEFSAYVKRAKALFTEQYFAERCAYGASFSDPIFIVGLPRSGSTLVEQILASHSAVEGTSELLHVTALARSLIEADPGAGETRYPDLLQKLTASESRTLGQTYIEQTHVLRKLRAQFFIDKMPNNFAHVGLIQLLLPNARIVDVRRHPMACGLSLFKHLFAHGQHFSDSLEDIGRYYRDYVELMAHFDAVLPGRVHRIIYESLVDDTETEVRRLLEYCGLPFEASCLRFHENRRAVSTASSEQVRLPIFREALDHWRRYEPWLDALKAQLGPLVDTYPEVASQT